MRARLEGGLSGSLLRLLRLRGRWFRGGRRFRGHGLWRHVLGLHGSAVSERISGLVRHHTDDRDNNDNARNPHRSFILNLAWIVALWPHLVAEVVFVEISHGHGSFFGRPPAGCNARYRDWVPYSLPRPAPPPALTANRTAPPSATVQGACLEGGFSGETCYGFTG